MFLRSYVPTDRIPTEELKLLDAGFVDDARRVPTDRIPTEELKLVIEDLNVKGMVKSQRTEFRLRN